MSNFTAAEWDEIQRIASEPIVDWREQERREKTVRGVKGAAERLATAEVRLRNEMREARKSGASLREIAAAAGVSHETARKITGSPSEE